MKKYIIIVLILMLIIIVYGIYDLNNKDTKNVNENINEHNSMILYDSHGNPLKDLSSMFNVSKT